MHRAADANVGCISVAGAAFLENDIPDNKKVWGVPDFFAFSYEGGDSEFINYLDIIINCKCVQNVFRLLEKNKNTLRKIKENIKY